MLWGNLSLVAQLNCICDGLAKAAAVSRSLLSKLPGREQYLLPLEHVAVFVQEDKSTMNVSKEVRYCLGQADARRFYMAPRKKRGGGLGWSKEQFNQVLRGNPNMPNWSQNLTCTAPGY